MIAPEVYLNNNAAKTLTLLRAMLKHHVTCFVFSSTAAVYGEPRRLPIVAEHPLDTVNAYGESKLLVERMLAWFHKVHGLRYATLRYFNAAGASGGRGEADRPETQLIPLVLRAALGETEAITVYGTDYPTKDGTCIRDYVHIDVLVEAHLLALHALAKHSQVILNVGTGNGFSVREVISVARKITGKQIAVVEAPRRAGDSAVLIASSQKI